MKRIQRAIDNKASVVLLDDEPGGFGDARSNNSSNGGASDDDCGDDVAGEATVVMPTESSVSEVVSASTAVATVTSIAARSTPRSSASTHEQTTRVGMTQSTLAAMGRVLASTQGVYRAIQLLEGCRTLPSNDRSWTASSTKRNNPRPARRIPW